MMDDPFISGALVGFAVGVMVLFFPALLLTLRLERERDDR